MNQSNKILIRFLVDYRRFKGTKMNNTLNESLKYLDMEHQVYPVLGIDQYRSQIGDDSRPIWRKPADTWFNRDLQSRGQRFGYRNAQQPHNHRSYSFRLCLSDRIDDTSSSVRDNFDGRC